MDHFIYQYLKTIIDNVPALRVSEYMLWKISYLDHYSQFIKQIQMGAGTRSSKFVYFNCSCSIYVFPERFACNMHTIQEMNQRDHFYP